ncbi:MAG: hypothetical protein GX564_02935, partial [Oligosphaeraceae bacterium]|nr:hypothetical protein [Oligosphaeraceae bacterium]
FEEIIRQRKYTHGKNGSIFFFLDTTGGCLSECTAHNVVTVPVAVRGMLIRANIWHNPGMARYSTNTIKRTLDSASREFQAAAGLNEALAKRGFIALEDVWRTARMRGNLESMGSVRGLCSATTNSASTLELDQEFPDVLSTAYVTLGPPGHTVFLPVPVCVQDIPEDIMDGSWSRAAIARLEDQGLEFDSALWLKPEAELQAVYQKALQDAREALRQGQREGAVARLQQAFAECCRRARQEVMPQ